MCVYSTGDLLFSGSSDKTIKVTHTQIAHTHQVAPWRPKAKAPCVVVVVGRFGTPAPPTNVRKPWRVMMALCWLSVSRGEKTHTHTYYLNIGCTVHI